ncbi:hypothetical protein A4S06_10360 [Erysipelotrichaceae bacterium MTC7]|nr:hypothetical protein A4S06_10360 [Erysipelotrichaceae bacterium MTC7]
MSYFQRIGKSLLLPIAIFPIAAILTGVGYAIEGIEVEWVHFLAIILQTSGTTILNYMPMAFSIGVAWGMSTGKQGFTALYGLMFFLIITNILNPMYISDYAAPILDAQDSFRNIDNQFIGILAGILAATTYNFLYTTKLSRLNRTIVLLFGLLVISMFTSFILLWIWPFLYNTLIGFGEMVSSLGPLGAGIYALCNRLLVPVGMHHPLNSVFWFDVIGINDIGNFWASKGTYGITGMYQAGFFPVMMFGLPAAALAMLHTAYPQNKNRVKSFLLSAAFASFFTGVTEPLEFSFMFIAPQLYVLHAILTGICVFIVASFQWIAGFSFSAGFIDYVLSYNMPFSKDPIMLIVFGIFVGAIYYILFVYVIRKMNLPTMGRESTSGILASGDLLTKEEIERIGNTLIRGVGGVDNIQFVECCITRIRFHLRDPNLFNFELIKTTGAVEYMLFGSEIQIVYGPQVESILDFVETELKHFLSKKDEEQNY